jgi:hypothetical protein
MAQFGWKNINQLMRYTESLQEQDYLNVGIKIGAAVAASAPGRDNIAVKPCNP